MDDSIKYMFSDKQYGFMKRRFTLASLDVFTQFYKVVVDHVVSEVSP